MARQLFPRRGDERGFTLTELLVVIVIIGILAAIAIPLYINQQARARDAAAQSDIAGVGRELSSQMATFGDPARVTLAVSAGHYVLWIYDFSGSAKAERLGGVSSTVNVLDGTGKPLAEHAEVALLVRPTDGAAGQSLSRHSWCMHVYTEVGRQKAWRYTAERGLEPGLCAAPGSPTELTYNP